MSRSPGPAHGLADSVSPPHAAAGLGPPAEPGRRASCCGCREAISRRTSGARPRATSPTSPTSSIRMRWRACCTASGIAYAAARPSASWSFRCRRAIRAVRLDGGAWPVRASPTAWCRSRCRSAMRGCERAERAALRHRELDRCRARRVAHPRHRSGAGAGRGDRQQDDGDAAPSGRRRTADQDQRRGAAAAESRRPPIPPRRTRRCTPSRICGNPHAAVDFSQKGTLIAMSDWLRSAQLASLQTALAGVPQCRRRERRRDGHRRGAPVGLLSRHHRSVARRAGAGRASRSSIAAEHGSSRREPRNAGTP